MKTLSKKASEFVNSKLGDKNYTHSKYPMSRIEIEDWLIEFAKQQANDKLVNPTGMEINTTPNKGVNPFDNSDVGCFHECPECNCRCNCSDQPCSCCNKINKGNYIEIPLELYRDISCYFNASFAVHKSYTNLAEKIIITEWGLKNAKNPTLKIETINDIEKYYLHYE
jgi:hypothetical protein